MSRTIEQEFATDALRRGRVFGLDLAVGFSFPGLPPDSSGSRGSSVIVVRAERKELSRPWPPETEMLADRRRADGVPLFRVEAHPDLGYRMTAVGWGRYTVTPDGSMVRCAPVRAATWRWQRYLVGQVLPFVSIVHGFEVFHASAVSFGDRTVAFTGGMAAGKSSLATALLRRGWRLVADDVIAVELTGVGAPTIHPGPGLLSVRRDAVTRFGRQEIERMGRIIGGDDETIRVVVPVATEPAPLTDFFVLERGGRGEEPHIESLRPIDPRLLLSATFNLVLRRPERLVRLLDVCARISHTVRICRLTIPRDAGPDIVAERVAEHALVA